MNHFWQTLQSYQSIAVKANFDVKEFSTLHGSQAPMVYSHEAAAASSSKQWNKQLNKRGKIRGAVRQLLILCNRQINIAQN